MSSETSKWQHRSLRWFYAKIGSMLSVTLGQQRQQGALPQVGLAIEERLLCREQQRQLRAIGGQKVLICHHCASNCNLMKNCVTTGLVAFQYLQDFHLKLSEAQVKGGVLVGPKLKKIPESRIPKNPSRKDKAAWNSFVALAGGFEAKIYVELAQTLVNNYGKMCYRLLQEVHIFDAHPYNFKHNIGAYSEEQDITSIKQKSRVRL